jgi:undecaprenyl-diphosphatase
MDLQLYEALNGFAARHDGVEDPLRFFALQGQVFFALLLAGLFVARGKWRSVNGRHGVIAAGFSAALALGIAQVLAHLWERPRPYIAHPGEAHLFIPASHDPSFPATMRRRPSRSRSRSSCGTATPAWSRWRWPSC